MCKGFIKLDRSIFNHWIFQDADKFRAFVDLIQLARWKDEKLLIGNEIVVIPRGSYYTSELKLSERWKWSRKKTRIFLELLEKESMISKEGTTKGTMLTIENYGLYQDVGTAKDTTKDILSHREKDWFEVGQEKGKNLDSPKETEWTEKGTTEDTTESVDITALKESEGTTKGTSKEHQKDSEGYIKGTSKEHQKNSEGYTKEEREEKIRNYKNREEGKEREEEPTQPPLSFSSNLHKVIFNNFGEVGYRTWFIDSVITEKDKEIIIDVKQQFKKDAIQRSYSNQLALLTGKKIIVKEVEDNE